MNDNSNKEDSFLDESLERLRRNDPTLTILNLNNEVGLGRSNGRDKGGYCHLLATALKHNTHLVVLFLNNTDLVGSSVAFLELAQSIGRHPTLAYCYMSYNQRLGDVGAAVLAQHALRRFSPPPVSTMNSVEGKEEGTCHRHHRQQQHHHHGLRVLKLANNNIGRAGARALAEALKLQRPQRRNGYVDGNNDDASSSSSWGLQSLVLQHNRIFPQGLLELAHAMRSNTSLVSLNVRHNQVADDAMPIVQQGFVNSLRHDNRTLSELVLSNHDKNDQESNSSTIGNVDRELHYYLDWNRLGRQYFGDAAIPATAWTRVLAKAASVSARKSSSPFFSELQQQQQQPQQQNVDQSNDALPTLPPPTPPSLLFTTLRARPDLLQQQEQQEKQQTS